MKTIVNVFINGKKAPKRPKLHWTIGPVSEQTPPVGSRGLSFMVAVLTDTQKAAVSVSATDGHVTVTPQNVTFSISDTGVATLTQDPSDDTKGTLVAVAVGTATITATGNAPDGTPLTPAMQDITVVAGQFGLVITIGTPEAQ